MRASPIHVSPTLLETSPALLVAALDCLATGASPPVDCVSQRQLELLYHLRKIPPITDALRDNIVDVLAGGGPQEPGVLQAKMSSREYTVVTARMLEQVLGENKANRILALMPTRVSHRLDITLT